MGIGVAIDATLCVARREAEAALGLFVGPRGSVTDAAGGQGMGVAQGEACPETVIEGLGKDLEGLCAMADRAGTGGSGGPFEPGIETALVRVGMALLAATGCPCEGARLSRSGVAVTGGTLELGVGSFKGQGCLCVTLHVEGVGLERGREVTIETGAFFELLPMGAVVATGAVVRGAPREAQLEALLLRRVAALAAHFPVRSIEGETRSGMVTDREALGDLPIPEILVPRVVASGAVFPGETGVEGGTVGVVVAVDTTPRREGVTSARGEYLDGMLLLLWVAYQARVGSVSSFEGESGIVFEGIEPVEGLLAVAGCTIPVQGDTVGIFVAGGAVLREADEAVLSLFEFRLPGVYVALLAVQFLVGSTHLETDESVEEVVRCRRTGNDEAAVTDQGELLAVVVAVAQGAGTDDPLAQGAVQPLLCSELAVDLPMALEAGGGHVDPIPAVAGAAAVGSGELGEGLMGGGQATGGAGAAQVAPRQPDHSQTREE